MRLRDISLAVVALDQLSKYLVMRFCSLDDPITLVKDYLYLTYIHNPGAAFGFMATLPGMVRIPFFIVITVGAGLIVYAYQRFVPPDRKWTRAALGLIWGGAMGNFVDRIFYRQVVDFIDVRFNGHQWFPYIFNLADSCITVGIIILVLGHWLEKPARPVGEA